MVHPLLFPWFGSEWLLAVSKKKFCLRRDEDFRISNTSQKKVTTALKAIPPQEFQKCFQYWQYRSAKRIAAEGECFGDDPSQYAVSLQVWMQNNISGNFLAAPRSWLLRLVS
jgi:hypothetical protein